MRLRPRVGRRRRDRRRLRDEHHLLEALLDSVSVAVVTFTADGELAHSSRRARELFGSTCPMGTPPEAWIGELRPRTPSGLPLLSHYLPPLRALQNEAVVGVDVLVRAGGRDVLLGTIAKPVNDARGRRCGAVLILTDVTERRAQQAVRRIEPPQTSATTASE